MDINKYIDKLNSLKVEELKSEKIALILSGQSSFEHSLLAPEQIRVLNIFEKYSYEPLLMGFPFHSDFAKGSYKKEGILAASYRNILQYLYLLFNKNYQKLLQKLLKPLLSREGDILIFCQSQGLKMLEVACRGIDIKANIQVVAIGPVTLSRFKVDGIKVDVIRGNRDYISMIFDRNRVDYTLDCGHMDYLHSSGLEEIINKILD